jgi:hypothetical protein
MHSASKVINEQIFEISPRDREILRGLAARVAEVASRPIEAEKRELWYRHNSLEATRPLIFCDPENGWYEILTPDQLKCEGNLARIWEFTLRKEMFWAEEMQDDRVIEACFRVNHVYTQGDWGLNCTLIGGDDNGAYTWKSPLSDYPLLDEMHFREIRVDYERTQRLTALAQEAVGGSLEVRLEGAWWWSFGMTKDLIQLRGFEQVLLDMYDNPAGLHKLMEFLRDENIAKLEFFEKNGLLSLNNEGHYVGSGGFGWTRELPAPGFDSSKVRPMDLWGFAESQETTPVSPEMFKELVFRYQLPLLERFGLNYYGCCEPLDKRWHIIEKTPNLRRVSVSAWADVKDMAEKLGSNYLYARKVNPADIALPEMDEGYIRQGLRGTLKATRNCRVELIMKDNHTIGRNPRNVIRWCRIAREEAEAL